MDKEHREYKPERNELLNAPRGKDPTPQKTIAVTQKNPVAQTEAYNVKNKVVIPPVTATPDASFRFSPFTVEAEIHEYLFEVRKAGSVFWVGAAVPKGTTDFTRAQIFFHPTVVNGGVVHADDKDYRDFQGGWPSIERGPSGVPAKGIQRYVAMQGGQLAGADRLAPLLVPFTTMAALNTKAPAGNMFSDRPVETLNAVMAAIQSEITKKEGGKPTLATLGVASFSSGIMALRLFLAAMRSSGLVKEVIDFDSPHIKIEPKTLTRAPGAVSKCFTQVAASRPEPGYVTLMAQHFATITAYSGFNEPVRLHARIGWMMYYQAMKDLAKKK